MKKNILLIFAAVFIGISLVVAYTANAYKRKPVEIYVPCGMTLPFQEIIRAFESESGAKVKPYYDNGAILARLILNKNQRPDIFVSTGDVEMKNLLHKEIIDAGAIRQFGAFNLVLYASLSNPAGLAGIADLKKAEVKTIAIADPRFNSVGSSAEEALEKAGVLGDVKEKIVYTDSPIQALTLVASGKAQAGIHYDTCPFDTTPEKMSGETIKIIQKIPAEYYRPITAEIAILKEAKNKKLASLFIDFLTSEKGQKILNERGIKCQPTDALAASKNAAAVKIIAYYPLNEEHMFIADYLKSLEKKYPGRVAVRVVDFRTTDGYAEWRTTGLACAGVFLNGKSEFQIDSPEGPKQVRFLKRLDTFWTREDFEKVVQDEIASLRSQ